MPINLNDPQELEFFRQQAKAKGLSDQEIEEYIGSKRAEQYAQEARSTSPMSDKLAQHGLLGSLASTFIKPGEEGMRYMVGSGAALGMVGKGLYDVATGKNPEQSETYQMLKQGIIPYLNPAQGKTVTSTENTPKAYADIAEQGARAGAGLATYGIPVKGPAWAGMKSILPFLAPRMLGGFGIGATYKGAEQGSTVGEMAKSGGISAVATGILSLLGVGLQGLRGKKAVEKVVTETPATTTPAGGEKSLAERQVADMVQNVKRRMQEAGQDMSGGMTSADKFAKLKAAGFDIPDAPSMRKIIEEAPDEVIDQVVKDAGVSGTPAGVDMTDWLRKNPEAAKSVLSGNLTPEGNIVPAGDTTSQIVENARRGVEENAANRPGLDTKVFAKNFTVPTKIAGKGRLDVMATSKKMMEYGIGQNGDLNEMRTATEMVTGKNGIVSSVVRDALAKSNQVIDPTDAVTAATESVAKHASLDDTVGQKAVAIVKKSLEANNAATPAGAFDAIQELEGLGHAEAGKSTYLTVRPGAEDLGDVYLAAADALKKKLNTEFVNKFSAEAYKTPAILDALKQVSPKLAEDFAKASTLGEVRALQAPFVKLSQIIDQTEMAQFSQASKLAGAMGGGGTVEKIVNATVGPTASVLNQAVAQPVSRRVGSIVASVITKLGPIVSGIGNTIGQTAGKAGDILSNEALLKGAAMLTGPKVETPAGGSVLAAETTAEAPAGEVPKVDDLTKEEQTEVTQQLSMASITPDMLMMAALVDPKNKELYFGIVRLMKADTASGSATQVAATRALTQLKGLYTSLEKKGLTGNPLHFQSGGLQGAIAARLQTDADATAYESTKQAFIASISRGSGERGVLTDKDIERIQKALPNLTDTPEVAAAKFTQLEGIIGMLTAGAGSATDTSADTTALDYLLGGSQ